MGLIKEFREFAVKGNFIDLAVGVIIGAASGKVVNALVEKVIMPPVGLVTGRVDFNQLKIVLQEPVLGPDGKEVAEVAIGYGAALQSLFELVIIAAVVFIIVRAYNRLRAESAPAGPSAQEELLMEIRDIMKEQAADKR